MPEPALADHQRHTLTSHLDRVRVTKLMLAFARAPVAALMSTRDRASRG
jgi:hypothetical protein